LISLATGSLTTSVCAAEVKVFALRKRVRFIFHAVE
jgi:hypothetical protein